MIEKSSGIFAKLSRAAGRSLSIFAIDGIIRL